MYIIEHGSTQVHCQSERRARGHGTARAAVAFYLLDKALGRGKMEVAVGQQLRAGRCQVLDVSP